MNYLEIRIYTDKCNLDPLTYILEDIGIAGFVVEDPDDLTEFLEKKNSYDWDYVDESVMELSKVKCNLCFYLDDSQEGKVQLENIRRQLNGCAMKNLDIHVTKVCDDTWKDNWKEYFKPAKITDRLVVKPTWEPYEKENSNQLVIEIDPGMAFGTGTHETTSLCMKLLEKYMEAGDAVLDVGCGSGILSIAAGLLGASAVLGVDIDKEAVRVSKENVGLNLKAIMEERMKNRESCGNLEGLEENPVTIGY
ncbi:MAG: 50S ribosomal protein L11 methyltransferase, partial [Anaerovorax sp.]